MERKDTTFVFRDTEKCPCCGTNFEVFKLPHQDTCELRVEDRMRGHPMLRCSKNHQFSPCLWDMCCIKSGDKRSGDKYWRWQLTKAGKWKLQCPRCVHAATKYTVRKISKEGQTLFEFRVNKLHSWIPLCGDQYRNSEDRTSQRTVRTVHFRLKLPCENHKIHAERKGTEDIIYATRLASGNVTPLKLDDSVKFFLCPRDPQKKRRKRDKGNSLVDLHKSPFWPKTPLQGIVKQLFPNDKICEVECKRNIPWTYQDSPRFAFRHGQCRRNVVRPYKRGRCICCSKEKLSDIEESDLDLYKKLNLPVQVTTGKLLMGFTSWYLECSVSPLELTNTDSSLTQTTKKKRRRKAQSIDVPEAACELTDAHTTT